MAVLSRLLPTAMPVLSRLLPAAVAGLSRLLPAAVAVLSRLLPAAMAVLLGVRGAGRALLAARALPATPGPCSRRGCGEAAALRAMGFSQEQAQRLLALQPRLGPEQREAAAAQLLLLGLSAEAAVALLERSPALLRLPAEQLRERAEELRRLGLDGGRLWRAVSRCPQLFHVPRRRLEATVRLLRERCLFTAKQLREVLGTCPTVLLEEPRTLHQQFQYAYFRMGVQQKEMVKARLFQMPFAELRNRHIFLERRGLYETPHKGQTQTSNPKLKDILQLPEKDFLASLAYSTPEEYEVFKKLLAREKEEEDVDALYTEDDADLDIGESKASQQ